MTKGRGRNRHRLHPPPRRASRARQHASSALQRCTSATYARLRLAPVAGTRPRRRRRRRKPDSPRRPRFGSRLARVPVRCRGCCSPARRRLARVPVRGRGSCMCLCGSARPCPCACCTHVPVRLLVHAARCAAAPRACCSPVPLWRRWQRRLRGIR